MMTSLAGHWMPGWIAGADSSAVESSAAARLGMATRQST